MEVNKISQIIALCDSIPVMLDTKILDAESAIKTLALIRQLAEEAQKVENNLTAEKRLALFNLIKSQNKFPAVIEVSTTEPEKADMVYFDRDGNLTKETQNRLNKLSNIGGVSKPSKSAIKRHLRDATHKFVLYQVVKSGGVRWAETDDDLYRDEMIERGYTLAEAE
ncbi:hypothetical protein R0R95_004629 [Salmonella enterica]|nr:hypothetical protein [Salmonella enterica]